MAELIIGVGCQKSGRRVLAILDGQVREKEGVPRKLHACSRDVEISGERPGFEGDFQSFQLRVRASGDGLEALIRAADSVGNACSRAEQDGWLVLRCPGDGKADSAAAAKAFDKLCESISLPEVWRVRGEDYRPDRISVELLFKAMVQYKASDVHIFPGQSPVFRVDNENRQSEILPPLSAQQILDLIREIAADEEWEEFNERKQTSLHFHQVGLGYSRVSAFMKQGSPHCTFRFLPEVIPSFEDLNIPRDTMVELASLHHGLVLVTGMTGSGKTTTVAALVDWINSNKSVHILTIEHPIEYVHNNKKAIISQRNTGTDVLSFNEAVTGALRHDPDVIVIGEMRDPDTIRSAINAAATGHLVISTLHSNTAAEVVNRIVSFFDPVERDLVKLQLRDCLRCVICQRLVPKVGGGRIVALEVMFNDIKPINDGIVEGDTDGIRIGMQQTISHSFLFEDYLRRLYKEGKVTLENARFFATERSIFDQMIMGTYSVPRLDTIKAAREQAHH